MKNSYSQRVGKLPVYSYVHYVRDMTNASKSTCGVIVLRGLGEKDLPSPIRPRKEMLGNILYIPVVVTQLESKTRVSIPINVK